MTWAQWLLEAYALRDREQEEQKLQYRLSDVHVATLRAELISLLGLNLRAQPAVMPVDAAGLPRPIFTPLSVLVARPEAFQAAMSQAKRTEHEEAATSDETFDAFSAALHAHLKGESTDLNQGFVSALTKDVAKRASHLRWDSPEMQQAAAAMGLSRGKIPLPVATHTPGLPKIISDALEEERRVQAADDDMADSLRNRAGMKRIDEAELQKYRDLLGNGDGGGNDGR